MKRIIGIVAALVLASVAIFDIAKENRALLGIGPMIILLTFGFVMWHMLSKLTKTEDGHPSGLPINLSLWLHSLLEGGLAALSFSFGLKSGLIVTSVLILHLLPEALAVMASLRQIGYSYRSSLRTYMISVGLLLTGFGLFLVTTKTIEPLLSSIATLVAGSFIYIALITLRRSSQPN